MVKYIEIGGESRPVCYNNNAIEEFEELTGQSVLEGQFNLKKVKYLKALVFCGLKHGFLEVCDYKKEFPHTTTDVGRWFDMSKTPMILESFSSATDAGEAAESQGVGSEKKQVGATYGQ